MKAMLKKLTLMIFISLHMSAMNEVPSADHVFVYKTVDNFSLKLHVFTPPGHKSSNRAPAIVFFHGGGWQGGGFMQFSGQCDHLASRGMVAITAQYRTTKSNQTSPKECVMDAKSAMRFVRSYSNALGIDPNRIAAGGGSAGGHLAAATAILEGFNEKGEDLTVSCVPNALVLFNPVLDNSSAGYGYDRVRDYWKKFSPLHNIHELAPPTLILLGSKDTAFKPSSARDYKARMEALGRRCDLKIYQDQPHSFFNRNRSQEMYYRTLIDADKFLVSLGYLPKKNISLSEFFESSPDKVKYDTSHESIASYDVPAWYSEGKLGIFMHLSAFSVPAFKNEWYASNIYYADDNPTHRHKEYRKSFRDHHEKTYGPLKDFGYKDFIPMLTMKKFDADYYADLVKKSGATYFAAPAVHHDGFAMWDSRVIDWNSVKMGPKRDVVGELTEAMRKRGIKAGVSTHYGRHWKYYTFRPEFDTWDPANEGLYGKRRGDNDPPRPEDALKWESVLNELIDNYQPDYIFVDGGVCDGRSEYKKEYFNDAIYRVAARYYNRSVEWNKEVVLSWKRDAMKKGEAVYDTEGILQKGIPERPWQAHFTANGKWGYMGERSAKPTDSILRCFVDLVSRNGNLLLNIGPRPDGTLDQEQEKLLLEIGSWMSVNGEGISGSEPWSTWGSGRLNTIADGKDINDYEKDAIRYTQKDGVLYAWFVDWPDNGSVVLPQAAKFGSSAVNLLGQKSDLKFIRKGEDIVVKLPTEKSGKYVWGLRLTKEMRPQMDAHEEDLAAVAAAAVAMSGGDDSGPLPTRYRLAKPAPFPKGGEWFKQAGLGLFIHWGPASVPDIEDVWRIRQPVKDSLPLRPKVTPEYYYENAPKGFTAEKYDPQRWMQAASKAGFRYSVLTSKHHDGYALWPTTHTDLGVRTYLNGRDLLQPYVDALRSNDMKVGFYFSGVDWNLDRDYMNYYFSKGVEGWDFKGEPLRQDAVKALPMEIIEQKKKMAFEVMQRYRPDLWWWDSGLPVSLEETAGRYNPDMIFNNRGNWYHERKLKGTYPITHFATPEGFHSLEWKYVKSLIKEGIPWEVCMTFQRCGWFYHSPIGEETGSLENILYALARVRSWQGNLLLNISPRADGSLPDAVYENFEKMANWMKWGNVSMFDTMGTHFPEKSNVPITTSRDGRTWYLHARPGPQTDAANWGKWKKIYYVGTQPGKPIRVSDLPKVRSAKLLRTGKKVSYSYEDGVLIIPNPAAGPNGLHEVIELKF